MKFPMDFIIFCLLLLEKVFVLVKRSSQLGKVLKETPNFSFSLGDSFFSLKSTISIKKTSLAQNQINLFKVSNKG